LTRRKLVSPVELPFSASRSLFLAGQGHRQDYDLGIGRGLGVGRAAGRSGRRRHLAGPVRVPGAHGHLVLGGQGGGEAPAHPARADDRDLDRSVCLPCHLQHNVSRRTRWQSVRRQLLTVWTGPIPAPPGYGQNLWSLA
jgi:hypothetical protein